MSFLTVFLSFLTAFLSFINRLFVVVNRLFVVLKSLKPASAAASNALKNRIEKQEGKTGKSACFSKKSADLIGTRRRFQARPGQLDLYAILNRETYRAYQRNEPRFLAWEWLHARIGSEYGDLDNFSTVGRVRRASITRVTKAPESAPNTPYTSWYDSRRIA